LLLIALVPMAVWAALLAAYVKGYHDGIYDLKVVDEVRQQQE